MAKTQNDSSLPPKVVNAALEGDLGFDIAVGPMRLRVPAQALADARASWSAFRAEAGEDAARRTYEAMAAGLDKRIQKVARAVETDRPLNEDFMNRLVLDLIWRRVITH
jgi:hypothetical protein